jgi:uncharacterized protein YdeI (YjbR/CyaY-like superfamily)
MEVLNGTEIIGFPDVNTWESWLAHHHTLQQGVWLKIAKVGSGIESVSEIDVLDVALCYGWISGQRRPLNQHYYLQKYVPRRRRSLWSQVNIAKVEALIAAGRMREPGLAEVAAAKADGRWDAAYESQKTADVPADLCAALESNQRAREFFDSLNRSERYSVIHRLLTARNDATRASRLQKLLATLDQGEKLR